MDWDQIFQEGATAFAKAFGSSMGGKLGDAAGDALVNAIFGNSASKVNFENEINIRLIRIETKVDEVIQLLEKLPEVINSQLAFAMQKSIFLRIAPLVVEVQNAINEYKVRQSDLEEGVLRDAATKIASLGLELAENGYMFSDGILTAYALTCAAYQPLIKNSKLNETKYGLSLINWAGKYADKTTAWLDNSRSNVPASILSAKSNELLHAQSLCSEPIGNFLLGMSNTNPIEAGFDDNGILVTPPTNNNWLGILGWLERNSSADDNMQWSGDWGQGKQFSIVFPDGRDPDPYEFGKRGGWNVLNFITPLKGKNLTKDQLATRFEHIKSTLNKEQFKCNRFPEQIKKLNDIVEIIQEIGNACIPFLIADSIL